MRLSTLFGTLLLLIPELALCGVLPVSAVQCRLRRGLHEIQRTATGIVHHMPHPLGNHHERGNPSKRELKKQIFMSRCKAALSLLCGLAFIVQLFERSITDPTKQRNNPLLRLLGTHNGYNNGVLLLTFSHALMNFSNLLDILHKQGDMSEEQEKLTEALTFCKDYRSEKEAAMAYDKAARIVLGPHTFTNFEEEDPKGSGASNIQSKYKGVIWSRKAKCWRVDTSLLVAD